MTVEGRANTAVFLNCLDGGSDLAPRLVPPPVGECAGRGPRADRAQTLGQGAAGTGSVVAAKSTHAQDDLHALSEQRQVGRLTRVIAVSGLAPDAAPWITRAAAHALRLRLQRGRINLAAPLWATAGQQMKSVHPPAILASTQSAQEPLQQGKIRPAVSKRLWRCSPK